uniref:Retrotrans_gag domain-containing protein n=1 Tax=Globodera pallida TaxID=36090 RepID=A0A183BRB4_GLOPA
MATDATIAQLTKLLVEQQQMMKLQSQQIDRLIVLQNTAPAAAAPIKCLMNKLSEMAFSEYSRSVLPSSVTDFNFATTIQKLEKLFAKPQSIFIDRYECLKAVRGEGEDFRQFVNRHKKLLADFKFDDLSKEQFYCLMLLTALKSHSDSVLRQRILAKLAMDGPNVKYESVVEDLINFQATVSEARAIEAPKVIPRAAKIGSRVIVGGAEANTFRETVRIEIGIAGSAMDLDIGSQCVSRTRHGFEEMELGRTKSRQTPFGLEE